jgi:aquaporin Z
MNLHKYLTEFLGTFSIIMVILITGNPILVGLTVMLVIFIALPISGGHMNPAISFALVSIKQMETELLFPYIASQILGGLAAVELYHRYKK